MCFSAVFQPRLQYIHQIPLDTNQQRVAVVYLAENKRIYSKCEMMYYRYIGKVDVATKSATGILGNTILRSPTGIVFVPDKIDGLHILVYL